MEPDGFDSVPDAVEEAFRLAVTGRDAAALRDLLRRHPVARMLVDRPLFPFDSPALVHVAGSGDIELVDVLLEAGADPNLRSDWWAGGFHVLHVATGAVADRLIQAGAIPDVCAAVHLDRPDLLLAILGMEPGRVNERGGDGQTPLHFARSCEVADLLIDRGAVIDARDVDHNATAAQWMLSRSRDAGRYRLARHLVDRGATADIFLAAALGLTHELRSMLGRDRSLLELRTAQDDYGPQPPASYHIYFWTIGPNRSPLQVATQFEQPQAVEVLRSFASPRDLFLDACVAGRADEARQCLEERPRLIEELRPGDHRLLADAAWAPDPAAVELMMELGFDPAAPGHEGGSALHCAAWEGSAAAVHAILRYPNGRALIPARDPAHNATPLGWCCHGACHCGGSTADHATVARLLLEAGATPGRDCDGAPESLRAVLRSH